MQNTYPYATGAAFPPEQWIWLPAAQYPNRQTTAYSHFFDKTKDTYTVAEFKRSYTFDKPLIKLRLRVSADTQFMLFCNGNCVATGPAPAGCDYRLGRDIPRPEAFASELELPVNGTTADLFARVKMMPVHMYESSKGRGGFMLSGIAEFADGSTENFATDGTWQVRYNGAYTEACRFDGRIAPDDYLPAECIENLWHTFTAPIPVRVEQNILPQEGAEILLAPGEEKEVQLTLDKIYAGFVALRAQVSGPVQVDINCREIAEPGTNEYLWFAEDTDYRGFHTHSTGNMVVKAKNHASTPAKLQVYFISTHYPVEQEARTLTSDNGLNLVLDTCRHTLKICRQMLHLDSPRHCEPLSCTGDYYIESLMTLYSFGDMRLAEFDVLRTADLLRQSDGRMFHTTYSLIWVRMLYDVYQITGHRSLLENCTSAMEKLFARFAGYIGENGLIETPPDYMFVDWIYTDNLSMHHPPKAFGQTCLNLFYFGALDYAAKIYRVLGQEALAAEYDAKKEALRTAINTLLYDPEKEMYFAGLNTPTPQELVYTYMPQNVQKRYYVKQPNILAAWVGVCDAQTGKKLLQKIVNNEIEGEYQPYFAHFLLDAVYTHGLRDKYTLQILEQWKQPVADCPKGLVEGFVKPEPTYSFDHSHAWGGTPLYSLPQALLGLRIDRPGMQEITLCPNLLGLQQATVELPTPWGTVTCHLQKGQPPKITAPREITVHF